MKNILGRLYKYLNLIKHNVVMTGLGHTSYCKHSPTCSHYLVSQIKKRGLVRGCARGLKRVLSCY